MQHVESRRRVLAGGRKGWALRSGDFAILCDNCGSAYEQSVFCEVFHSKDSGWRECTSCGKRLHCGCIASKSLLELLDGGGVNCTSCSKSAGVSSVNGDEKTNGFGMSKVDDAGELQSASADNQLITETKLMQLGNCIDRIATRNLLQLQSRETDGSYRKMKQEDMLPPVGEIASTSFSNFNQETQILFLEVLSMKGYWLRHPLHSNRAQVSPSIAKASKASLIMDANAGMVSQIRVARPPAEGRGRNQLLPRYWPRITDQELQQISGDPNSTIVPLFEKVLSASDAGRIGRLVLPKACAEAYFPPISQPEGLPLRIQDVKGKEWVFQFSFLGDSGVFTVIFISIAVTFSRMDPEGKLVMGFRKASNSIAMQDTQPSAIPNGIPSSESYFSGVFENLPIISASGDVSWHKSEKQEARTRDGLLLPSLLAPERKRLRNIGSKSKRLLIIDSLDALELKVTWEEAQDLLRPEPSIKPSIVTIEDHDFEEYEVRTTGFWKDEYLCSSFNWIHLLSEDKSNGLSVIVAPSGEGCRLISSSPKWTCVDNAWDQSRSMIRRCVLALLQMNWPQGVGKSSKTEQGFQETEITSSHRPPRSMNLLVWMLWPMLAILGDTAPSGKGKHKPTCTCNVCMTVKRRFKTLMMRKKKRQSEREAEIAQRIQHMSGPKDEADVESSSKLASTPMDPSDNEARSGNELESKSQTNNLSNKLADSGKGHLDLNCHPGREEDSQAGLARMSMTSLLQVASLPLETYLKQNGLASLSEQQASSASHVPPQGGGKWREN
ncbi:hypothetical protein POTOM_060309 [Populus tomentosa]|uniref:TF-B3 domain-containing protein n=1 Tax=Populus tomentosa TaxID=118781 RepID=A0A8X7XTI6_POPTO|nr:hypothetical protein POTOM_060309 [Populus tomentosa]